MLFIFQVVELSDSPFNTDDPRIDHALASIGTIGYHRTRLIDIAAEHGPGIAEATAWRQYLDPRISDRQTLGMETDRLSLFNPTMRDTTFPQDLAVLDQQLATTPDTDRHTATGRIHLDFATGHGLPITALLLPEAWTLPFNTITEPYLQNTP